MIINVLFSVTCVVHYYAFAESEIKFGALKKLPLAVIKTLPVNSGNSRIAVLDFEKDDVTIKNAIISTITKKLTSRSSGCLIWTKY